MKYLPKNKNIVFDVGANVGNWSKKALSVVSDISLYSFEPIPLTFEILRLNANLYSSNNFYILLYGF